MICDVGTNSISAVIAGALVAFAVSGAVGGQFSYACPEGLSASCRAAEWRLALPHHHYVHVLAGIAEFVFALPSAGRA